LKILNEKTISIRLSGFDGLRHSTSSTNKKKKKINEKTIILTA